MRLFSQTIPVPLPPLLPTAFIFRGKACHYLLMSKQSPTGSFSKLLSITRIKITLLICKILEFRLRKEKFQSLFQRIVEKMQLLYLHCRGRGTRKVVTSQVSSAGRGKVIPVGQLYSFQY